MAMRKKRKRLVPFVGKIVLLIREIIYLIIVVHNVILSVGNIRNYKYILINRNELYNRRLKEIRNTD
jgi:hypothetical protein